MHELEIDDKGSINFMKKQLTKNKRGNKDFDRQGKIRLLLSLLILLLCVAGSYCIYRYIKHETL